MDQSMPRHDVNIFAESTKLDKDVNAGTAPVLPDVMTNWHHEVHLKLVSLDAAHITKDMLNLQVSTH